MLLCRLIAFLQGFSLLMMNALFWMFIVITGGMFLVSLVLLLQILIAKIAGRNNKKIASRND